MKQEGDKIFVPVWSRYDTDTVKIKLKVAHLYSTLVNLKTQLSYQI